MTLIDKEALRAIALRRSGSPADATLSINDLDAAEVCCERCGHWEGIEPLDVLGIGACCAVERFSTDNRLTTPRDFGCAWFTRREAT